MRGLAKGEASSTTKPLLQLYVRSGQYMANIFSGTFVIEEVRDPDGTPVSRVSQTAFNTAAIADGGDRVGIGRYTIATGDTATWNVGTHRILCRFYLEDGGTEYIQEILFEVLNATMFPTGSSYVGYAATRDLYSDGFFTFLGMPPEKLHRHISRVSKTLESLTNRIFEPRYMDRRINGMSRPMLFLDEAVIAIADIAVVEPQADGTEVLTTYEQEGYQVFNRHVDGLLNPDDRYNPKIEMTARFPNGQRNISVAGIFGFTDPDPDSEGVSLGQTPADLVQIVGTLVDRHLTDPSLSSPSTWQPGRVKMYKTRDQQLQLYGASGAVDLSGGLTGDSMLDQLLQRFVKPARLTYVERRVY